MQSRRQSIPVILLLKSDFQILWQQRDDALRLGLVPALLLFAGIYLGGDTIFAVAQQVETGASAEMASGSGSTLLLLSAMVIVALSLLMVNWLRFLLLGPMGAVGIGLTLRAAHFRFLVASIVFLIGLTVAVMAISLPLVLLLPVPVSIANLLAILLSLLVAVRFLPFMVGQAIDQPMTLRQSWAVSRGNALTLAMGLVLVQVPFMIGLAVVEQFLALVGFIELAPVGTMFIIAVAQVAVWICLATLFAAAYRHLVGVRV